MIAAVAGPFVALWRDFNHLFSESSMNQLDIAEWISLAAGLLFLFAGWFFYWFSTHLTGGVLLAGAGLLLAGVVSTQMDLAGGQEIAVLIGGAAAGALIGIVLARAVHALAFFLIGCATGAALFYTVMSAIRRGVEDGFLANDAFLAFGIPVVGVVVGWLAVAFSRVATIIVTSILGAALIMEAFGWPYAGVPMVPLALGGAIVQLAVARPRKRRAIEEEGG